MSEHVNIPLDTFKSYVGIKFDSTSREYFFGVKSEQTFKVGDYAIVETVRGLELGLVSNGPFDISTYK